VDAIRLHVTEPDEAWEIRVRVFIASYFFRGLESLEVT
jgi:hypothetical protein